MLRRLVIASGCSDSEEPTASPSPRVDVCADLEARGEAAYNAENFDEAAEIIEEMDQLNCPPFQP